MLKYYTIMVLSFFIEGEETKYHLVFPSYDTCSHNKARIRDTFVPFASHKDVHVYCKGSDVASNELVKPKVRPDKPYQ